MFAKKDISDITAFINASFLKGEFVPRVRFDKNGKRHVDKFEAYCAILLDGINNRKTPDTISDRSITITMKRRLANQTIQPYRIRNRPEGIALKDELTKFAKQVSEQVRGMVPDMPLGIEDRQADVWESLFIVADVADRAYGAHYPEGWGKKARDAALFLKVDDDDIQTDGNLLLSDIRDVLRSGEYNGIEDIKGWKVTSGANLLKEVGQIQTSDWFSYNYRGLTEKGMANLLAPFGIKPHKIRELNNQRRYLISDFEDAFKHNLPIPPGESATSAQAAPSAADEEIDLSGLPQQTVDELGKWG